MRAQKAQEEHYLLSGWQYRDDNEIQSENNTKLLRLNVQMMDKKTALPLSKIPLRKHRRNFTKDFYQCKISDITNLKRDKDYLQQHYLKENQLKLQSHRASYQQENSRLRRLHLQTQIYHPKQEQTQNHQWNQVEAKKQLSTEPISNSFLEKYTLFSGVNNQKRKKRKFLFRNHSKDDISRPKLITQLQSQKTTIMASKFSFDKIDKMDKVKEQRNRLSEIHKKVLKFPLFFRQLTSKEENVRRIKHNQTLNLQQKKYFKYSAEFADSNLFSSNNIRL